MTKKAPRPKKPKPITVDAAYRRVLTRILGILEDEGLVKNDGD